MLFAAVAFFAVEARAVAFFADATRVVVFFAVDTLLLVFLVFVGSMVSASAAFLRLALTARWVVFGATPASVSASAVAIFLRLERAAVVPF